MCSVSDALVICNNFPDNLKYLNTKEGKYALENKLITIEDIKKYNISVIYIPECLIALEQKLVILEDLSNFFCAYHYVTSTQPRLLTVLLSELGLQAIRKKLIDPAKAADIE